MAIPPIVAALFLLCMRITAGTTTVESSSEDSWAWLTQLKSMDGQEFRAHISPILQMTANAYRYPSSEPIQDWIPATEISPMAPSSGGCHAVAYTHNQTSPPQIVVAFRGTQITEAIDGKADLCVDMILWKDMDFDSLPKLCQGFNRSSLDYLSQAIWFVRRVMEEYPESKNRILLTGHSLGAGLAVLVSAAVSGTSSGLVLPVLGFGPPATEAALKRYGLNLRALELGLVVHVANQWDEIVRTHWNGQLGTLCLYPTEESYSCKLCFSGSYNDSEIIPSGSCGTCFLETHYLKSLIALADEGIKPECQEMRPTDMECLNSSLLPLAVA